MRIAIIMTVFNRKDKTLQCLRELKKMAVLEGTTYEIYLTDDGCTDGTSEAVKTEFSEVKIVKGDGSLYWNRGMHKAWEEAAKRDYDYYLWMNDDVKPYSYLLDVLIEASKGLKDKAIICGAVENEDKTQMTYGGAIKYKKFVTPNGETQKVDYSQGNIVLIPRYVYEIVGNLDPYYGHSRGDSDYGLTAGKLGIEYYQAKCYLGSCELHDDLPKCFNPTVPFKERWKALHHKTGAPPHEVWYYWKKHRNVIFAFYECLKVYVRCICPQIWVITNHATLQ